MSRIDDLIAQHCPDGVGYKTVGEVATYTRGVTYSKKDEQSDGPVRVLRSNNITLRTNTLNFDDVRAVSRGVRVRENQWLRRGDILVSAASGSRAHVGKVAHIDQDIDYCFGGFMAALRTTGDVDSRFLFHLLVGRGFSEYLASALATTTINNLSAGMVNAFRVPVPPLEVQNEIVRVLDSFMSLQSKLESELQAELEYRWRQYAHLRDFLLDPSSRPGIHWKPLSEISTNHDSRRKPVTKGVREPGPYPYYGASGVVDYVSDYIFDGDYLLVSEDGANLLARTTAIAFTASGKTWVNNHAHVLEFDGYVPRRFVEIYLNSIDLAPYVTGAAQPKLNKENVNRIPIPLPALEDQERIVAVLDKYDALVNDLSVCLLAELAARRQQYEYYRNRLLTFEERAA